MSDEPKNLGEWLAVNNPAVTTYLAKLSRADVGSRLSGVALSDGTRELADHVYVGKLDAAAGVHDYKFRRALDGALFEIHYIWVDEGAKPVAIPGCKGERTFPGGVAVLSGDVYTWREIQPDHGVVRTTCRLADEPPPTQVP